MSGDFHEILFPVDISLGSAGGPKFKTFVFGADSGFEARVTSWINTRAEYNVSQGVKSEDQLEALTNFFYARQGRAYGFRFKDWNDFSITSQLLGVGDGSTTTFNLIKTYTSAQTESGETYSYTRRLKKINWNSFTNVQVGVALVTANFYTIDYNNGAITFVTAPPAGASVIIGYGEFHVPVRFDTDQLDVTQEFWTYGSWPNIPLVEVRAWSDLTL